MTATDSTVSTDTTDGTTERAPSDLRALWRLLLAIALPLGPLGIVATRAVMPYWTNDDADTAVGLMVAEPGRTLAMQWIFFFAFPLLLMSVVGVAFVVRRGAPRLAMVGGLLTFASCALVGAVGSSDGVAHAMAEAGYDQGAIINVVEAMNAQPTAVAGTIVFVLGHIIGFVTLGVAVARSRVAPAWVGVMIAVSQPIHLVSAIILPSRLLDVLAGWGFTTIGFALVSLAVLRTPVDELDLPPSR